MKAKQKRKDTTVVVSFCLLQASQMDPELFHGKSQQVRSGTPVQLPNGAIFIKKVVADTI